MSTYLLAQSGAAFTVPFIAAFLICLTAALTIIEPEPVDARTVVANPERWDDICPPECTNPTGICDCWDNDEEDEDDH